MRHMTRITAPKKADTVTDILAVIAALWASISPYLDDVEAKKG